MEKEKVIYVFADFPPFHNELIGTIYVSQMRGKEFFHLNISRAGLKTDI